jgi:DNA-binding SARP family transcriptional activator
VIELKLLGPPGLTAADGRELSAVLAQPKRLALLVYLAVARPRGFHRRDKLVALFWPEFEQTRARAALNKAIHHLRQSMGDDAIVSRGDNELALNDAVVWCDVRQFSDAVAKKGSARALELYRGDLADGVFVDDAAAFEQWLSAERETLRAVAARAAGEVAEATRTESPARAVAVARRGLELAPYDEAALRRLMSLLALAGDRSSAALAYADFARRLMADLELEPSEETKALRDSLNRTDALPPSDATRPAALDAGIVHRVGRIAEIAHVPMGRRRFRALIPVGAMVAVAALAALTRSSWNVAEDGAADRQRVRVAVLENQTGDSTLNPVGAMASDWIAQGLTAADVAHAVYDPRANVGLVVSGSFYKQGDSLRFQVQLSDAADAAKTRVFQPVLAPIGNPAAALESLQEQALSIVAQATTPRQSSLLRGSTKPPLYAAYREYILGIDMFTRHDLDGAYDHFTRAAALDTSFTGAMLCAATSLESIGSGKVDSLIDQLAARREALPPVSQTWLAAIRATRRGDHAEVHRYFETLARDVPESFFPFRYASGFLTLRRPREAVARLRALDPQSRWMSGFDAYWVVLTMAEHVVGDATAEARDAATALHEYPDNPAVAAIAVRHLASTGRLAEADSLLDEARAMRQAPGWNAGAIFAAAALEGAAHGHVEWAARVRDRAVRWYGQLPSADRDRAEGPTGLTWMLYSVGAWPELEARVAELSRGAPTSVRWTALRAIIAARKGDSAVARAIDRELASLVQSSDGRSSQLANLLFERARIAGMLGDRDAAVDLLQQSLSRGLEFDVYLHADPAFAAMRAYPPFVRVVAPNG